MLLGTWIIQASEQIHEFHCVNLYAYDLIKPIGPKGKRTAGQYDFQAS